MAVKGPARVSLAGTLGAIQNFKQRLTGYNLHEVPFAPKSKIQTNAIFQSHIIITSSPPQHRHTLHHNTVATMATPRKSNVTQKHSREVLLVETTAQKGGGKSWWTSRATHDKATNKEKTISKPKRHEKNKVHLVGCKNGSIEVVPRNSTRKSNSRKKPKDDSVAPATRTSTVSGAGKTFTSTNILKENMSDCSAYIDGHQRFSGQRQADAEKVSLRYVDSLVHSFLCLLLIHMYPYFHHSLFMIWKRR